MNLITELQRRRRAARGLLALTLVPLAFVTARLAWHLWRPAPGLDPVDLGREWGIVPFLLLPWLGWLAMVALYRRHRTRSADFDQSIQASVAALLDENGTERKRYRVVVALLIGSVALLPLVIEQLRAVGEAGDEILLPAYVIYPAYVLLMVGWSVWHDRRNLQPRQRELETLLAAYR